MLRSKNQISNLRLMQIREENMKNWNEDDLLFYEDFFDGLTEKKETNSMPDDVFFDEAWNNFKKLKDVTMAKKLDQSTS